MAKDKIILEADHGKADKAAEATKKKYEGIGKGAQTVTTEMSKWGKQAANTLVGISAVLQAVDRMGKQIQQQRQAALNVGKEQGQKLLERGKNIRDLGLDLSSAGGAEGALAAITKPGAVSQDRMDAFLSSLAGMDAKKRPDAQTAMRAISLFQSGLFSESEVLGASGNKRDLAKLAATAENRRSRMTDAERKELELRAFENQQAALGTEALNNRASVSMRVAQASRQRLMAENPLAAVAVGTLNNMPVIGGIAETLGEVTYEGLGAGGNVARTLKNIEQSNARIAAQATPRPNYNTDAGGSQ